MRKGLTTSCGCKAKTVLEEYNKRHTADETGNTYGYLTVISRNTDPKYRRDGRAMWNCICKCGNKCVISGKSLRSGHTRSCGCLSRETSSEIGKITGKQTGGSTFCDITGQRFGKLVALEHIKNNKNGLAIWKCQCDCGNIVEVRGAALRDGNTTSCGCIKSKGEMKVNLLL